MDHPSNKNDLHGSSRTTNNIQENSVNQKTVNNVAATDKCLDDNDSLSEIEDLSKYCQPAVEEPELHNSYHEEWERLFGGLKFMDKLRSIGIKGHLRNCRFRSICWRVYLECLPEDKELWVSETEVLRSQYDKILHELQTNPRCDSEDLDLCLNNPLSQSEESPWNQFFQDSELKSTIQQDVCRTFPEIEFFHTEEVQAMMVNVLFCYARKFPHISYRQGMHELLAPIIFVLHSDQQAYLHASEIELLEFSISILLNPNYTEHDAFFLMCQLMDAVESWYVLNENISSKGHINFSLAPFVRDPESSPGNALGVKLIKIYEQLLRHHDPELFTHLQELEIAPPIYGIRWLRLLFGREFAMQDLLVIWDAIFANSISFDLVDYIFTAMLIFIRDLLLSSDYSSCISHLMRYPAVADVHYLVDLALHLKNPMQYKRPVGYSSQMLRHVPLVGGRKEIHRAPVNVPMNSSTAQQSTSEKSESGRPTSLALPSGTPDDSDIKSQNFRAALNSEAEQPLSHAGATSHRQSIDQSSTAMLIQSECDLQKDENLSRGMAKVLMGSDTYSVTGSTSLSHDVNYLETDKTKAVRPAVREMVPMVPQNIPSVSQPHCEHTLKKKGKLSGVRHKEDHLKQLTAQILEMKAMAEYCGRWMTVHIDKLQACMEGQELQHEDEMLISLAGLKRLRDILNGTVSFTREVMDVDEDTMFDSKTPPPPSVNNYSEKISDNAHDNHVDDFVVVQEDMCDGRNSVSPSKSVGSEAGGSAKSNVPEPQPEADSRSLGRSFASARRELCRLFLVSSPIPEKQSDRHVNR